MGKTIEIKVGTIFSVTGDSGRTDLIIDTGRGKDFFTVKCKLDNDQIEITGRPGTAGLENIDTIIKEIKPEDVERLLIIHWEKRISQNKINQTTLDTIRQITGTQPRRINLD